MHVLIADDNPTTRIFLRENLRDWGYEVSQVSDGDAAYKALTGPERPRIAILDWMMPGLDGVEVCRRLQEEEGALVYCILLTAKRRREDRLQALAWGAHEFQSKPVDPEEMRCRLRIAERLVEAEDRLQEYACSMETLASERAAQLVHADRLSTIGNFTSGILHDLSTPITCVQLGVEMLEMNWNQIRAKTEGGDKSLEKQKQALNTALSQVLEATSQIVNMTQRMRRFVRKEQDSLCLCDLSERIDNALLVCRHRLNEVRVDRQIAEGLPQLSAYPEQLEQVFVNLFSNAADAMLESKDACLRLQVEQKGDDLWIEVEDSGPGIDADLRDQVFQSYFTTKDPEKGTGLGLAICKDIIENHGGTIRIAEGSRFEITLPTALTASDQELCAAETAGNT